MRLDDYKLLKEDDKEFHLEHKEHGHFSVPKAHLHHATVERIQKHFCRGGMVRGYSGASGNPSDQEVKDPTAAYFAGKRASQGGAGDFPSYDEWNKQTSDPTGYDVPPIQTIGTQPPQASVPVPQQATVAPPVAEPQPLVGPTIPDDVAAQRAMEDRQANTGPSPTAGIDAGVAQERAGIEAGAASRQRWESEIGSMQQDAARQQAMLAQRTQDLITQRAAGAQKLADDVLNQKMDPNHFWETRTTGQKVSAAIGLILGGIGAGLTHGPNYAMQVIDKSIDRDIEAQKFNLQQGKNKLAFYMQQTGDLVSASQLAKADALTVSASQMQSALSNMGASAAAPDAEKAIGALNMQASQLRQQATMGQMQIEQTRLGMAYQKAQMGLLSNVMEQSGGHQQGGTGITIPPGAEMLLPKEMQETLVRLPGGKVDFARTPKDAEEVRKTQEATGLLRQKLQRYAALQQAHPNGISSVLSPEDFNSAKTLHNSILTDLNGLAGLNRFTEQEAQIFSGRIPDITGISRSSANTAKLNELGQEIDDKVRGTNKTYLRFSGGH